MLLAGEPGVGKTRLAEELTAYAGRLGMQSCWAGASDDEGSPPYWPFRQLVRTLNRAGPLMTPGPAVADLAMVAPELGGAMARGSAAAEQRFRVFEAVTEFLVAAAEPGGLLVVLDDVHWADLASLQLLTHLTRGAVDSRLMVLATYRDTEVGGREPLRRALAALARESSVTRLRLVGLTETEVGALLAGVTGWPVPASVAGAVSRRTQGNPFFVAALAGLLAGESVGQADADLPDGVRDAVRGRLGRLSAACRHVVSAAAVLGSVVDPVAVAASTGWELGRVLAALDEAAAAGIVTGSGAGRFGHDLIREAARIEVPTVERLGLHQRMAEYLAGRVDATDRVAEVAFHWLESLPVGDAGRAVVWAERAAGQAMAQLAWEEAAALYGRAVAAAADAALGESDRCRLLLAQARAEVRAFHLDGARRSLLAVATIARDAGDPVTLAEAALIMEGVTDFVGDTLGKALAEEALAGIPDLDSAVRARLLAQLAMNDSWRSFGAAESLSASALAMAERVGDRRAMVAALRARQIARSGPDGASDRLVLGDRMLAVGAVDGDDDAVLWGRLWRFDALAQLGDVDQAAAETGAIGAAAERLRSPLARWHTLRCRAAIALARGSFDDAHVLGEQAASLARRASQDGTLAPSLGFLLILQEQTGRTGLSLDDMIESASPVTRAICARMLVTAGRRAEALQVYRALPPPASVPGFLLLSSLALTAELAAEFDDRAAAGEVYRLLSPFAERFICGGAGVVAILGSARLPLGLAAATIGRLDDAVRHMRTAADLNERAGLPPVTATARYHLARILARRQRSGDRAEAGALAASAGSLAGQLGMAPLRQRCRELTGALSGRMAGPLTRREQEIAVLVSQGLTSSQIAAAAHITARTAENHVQHILGKLGFTSRAQIAAWVAAGQPWQEISTAAE